MRPGSFRSTADPSFVSLIIMALLLFCVSAILPNTSFADQRTNSNLINRYNSDSTKRIQSGDSQIPREVLQAAETLRSEGIKVYETINGEASASDMNNVIVQEYLRKQATWGMPWLPISWYTNLRHIEDQYDDIATAIEYNIQSKSHPLSQFDLLSIYMFVGSIVHTSQEDLVNKMRTAAHELGMADEDGFWDIRCEVHQEPSLTTIERINDYINSPPKKTVWQKQAQEVLRLLQALFGNTDVKNFLKLYSNYLDSRVTSILKRYQETTRFLTGTKKVKRLSKELDNIVAVIRDLGDMAITVSEALKNKRSACGYHGRMECSFELVDLLRQFQNATYTIGNLFVQRLLEEDVLVSVRDSMTLLSSFVKVNVAVGFMRPEVLYEIEQFTNDSSIDVITPTELRTIIYGIEQEIGEMGTTLSRMFGPHFGKYKKWVPDVVKLVDDTLRSSTALPMSNFIAALDLQMRKLDNVRIQIGDQDYLSTFRVLNPGVARGRLVILTEQDAMDRNYYWNPNFIYFLPKTPATLGKVEGIITADSGSAVSHVQLNARNHGLPNLYLPIDLVNIIRQYDGQEVYLATLSNGEAIIKLDSDITAEELQVYNDYHNVTESAKVRLETPERLDINYVKFLRELRMKDAGAFAGQKACGQGELANVLPPKTVPLGLVLPFGIYYEHIRDAGIYDEIQDIFLNQLPLLDMTNSSDIQKRRKILAELRNKIQNIKLKKELVRQIRESLTHDEIDIENVGVFVRSDTNAEDLPNFVGAGLNKTVPNVKGFDNILEAIKVVWSSPFREEALSWRENMIENPWDIYPSVIIQMAVSSTKAGVMVVGDPNSDDMTDMVFIASNEGIGITTVNGEYAPEEIIYMRSSGEYRRVQKAYAQTRKSLARGGGIAERAALGIDPLVSESDAKALADFGDRIQKHLKNTYGVMAKWDLEWGMIGDHVILFQIRTFIGNNIAKDLASLARLESENDAKVVNLTTSDRILKLTSGR